MPILTESKIKKLLRRTELKETKSLVLEPGTVITPSAKEYLKDITIRYMKVTEKSETENQETRLPTKELKIDKTRNEKSIHEALIYKDDDGKEIWKSQSIYQFKTKIHIIISRILILQKKGQHMGNMELVEALNNILMVFKSISIENKLELVEEIENLLKEKNPYSVSSYLQDSFIPTYKDEEYIIGLFELHAYFKELEYFIANGMKESLTFEDYINYMSIATILKEYCWILMVKFKEN